MEDLQGKTRISHPMSQNTVSSSTFPSSICTHCLEMAGENDTALYEAMPLSRLNDLQASKSQGSWNYILPL